MEPVPKDKEKTGTEFAIYEIALFMMLVSSLVVSYHSCTKTKQSCLLEHFRVMLYQVLA